MPCLVRWPNGNVPSGTVNNEFLTTLELLPSLAAATGAQLPADVVLDGFDWWSVIRGEQASPREEMVWKRKSSIGVRVGKWKWVEMDGSAGGLFDLEADIGEQHDLSASQPEVLTMVKNRYNNWLKRMEAAEPRGPFRDF